MLFGLHSQPIPTLTGAGRLLNAIGQDRDMVVLIGSCNKGIVEVTTWQRETMFSRSPSYIAEEARFLDVV